MIEIDEFSQLPEGWSITTLGDVVAIEMGQSPEGAATNIVGNGLPLIGGASDLGENLPRPTRYTSTPTKVSEKGDLILCVRATIGKLNYADNHYCLGRGVAGLRPISFERNWLKYYLNYCAKDLDHSGTGTTFRQIDKATLQNWSIPLAPINEQRRIVAKIEALKARSQWVKEAIAAIPPLLDQFRQSVLAAAFRGDLTADWREKNPEVEPASVLLERIRNERKKRYQEECKKAEAEGRRKPIPFKEVLEPIEFSKLTAIPNTWSWERLVNLSNILGGVTKGRKFGSRTTIMLPYLRVANVQDGFLDLTEIKEIEALPEDLEKYHLEYGDLLFTEGGDRDKLGRGTVWKDNIKNCIHQNHVYRARLYYSGITCDYISLATKSDYAKAYFFEKASQTVNLASINITSLGNVPLAIPPEEEQKEIVYRVQTLFKAADKIEQQYQEIKAHVDQLDQSILAKAFRGELVPQDPNDEPASMLLERIRAERGKREAEAKAAKNTDKTTRRRSRKQQPDSNSTQLKLPGLE